jgi:hypothetical protein
MVKGQPRKLRLEKAALKENTLHKRAQATQRTGPPTAARRRCPWRPRPSASLGQRSRPPCPSAEIACPLHGAPRLAPVEGLHQVWPRRVLRCLVGPQPHEPREPQADAARRVQAAGRGPAGRGAGGQRVRASVRVAGRAIRLMCERGSHNTVQVLRTRPRAQAGAGAGRARSHAQRRGLVPPLEKRPRTPKHSPAPPLGPGLACGRGLC